MTLSEFRTLLDTHGADPGRWPPALREPARALAGRDLAARRHWEAARRLDALLADAAAMPADTAREAAVIHAALRRVRARQAERPDWRWLVSRPMRAAFAATILVGWLAGVSLDTWHPQPAPEVPGVAYLLGYVDLDIEGLAP